MSIFTHSSFSKDYDVLTKIPSKRTIGNEQKLILIDQKRVQFERSIQTRIDVSAEQLACAGSSGNPGRGSFNFI